MKTICLYIAMVMILIFSWDEISFAEFHWDLDSGLSTGYDDNITFVQTNKISDTVSHVFLDGGFTQQGKTHLITLKTKLTENIFAQHPSFKDRKSVV